MRATALLVATTFALGCTSDSPTGPSARSLAVHFDSLWQRAVETNDNLRQIAMQYIAVPLAFGVSPHEVSITVDGKSATYQAVAFEFVDVTIQGTPFDSTYNFAAWADPDANRVIISQYLPAEQDRALGYLNGTAEQVSELGTITGTVVSATGTCSAIDLASVYYEASYSTCSHSVQETAFDIQFDSSRTVSEVKLGSVQLPAVRLYQHY
jgi:tryptophanyl-tRNA synthetase